VINFPHGQTAASAGVQAELRAFDARVAKASPGLREVSYASTGSRVLLGTGGKSTIVLVYPPRAGTDLPASVLSQLAAAARTAVPGAAVHSTGLSALSTSGAAAAHSSVLSELALGAITAGNPGHLERLFRNIIDNAIRFARARVVIRATSAETTVQVEVIDDGPGIPAAERDRVFDRFVRLDTSRERRTGTPGWGWQSPARSL
jgi:signal transduction histidine kinase